MALLLSVLAGFGISPLAWRFRSRPSGMMMAIVPLVIFAYFVTQIPHVIDGTAAAVTIPWVEELGITASFYLDGLSLMMALLVSGIGTLVFVYAGAYLAGDSHIGRMYAFLMLFMASMLGLVTAGNLVTMLIFWELTGISSYLLIGYKHNYESSRAAALQALLTTGIGGLCLMAGIIFIGMASGTTDIPTLLTSGDVLRESPYYLIILVLVSLGAFTKSAQMPFHFWLPGAMAAPTPVSSYLHSATMVKAGVYLLARMAPVLGDTPEWLLIVGGVGAVTMVGGALIAIYQTDLKKLLAYATISVLGTLVMLIGIGTKLALEAMIVFLLAHAFYKCALFMVAGIVDHETGTRDINLLGGLARHMPFTTAAAVIAGLSMAGIPFLIGFIGKELVYESTLEMGAELAFAPEWTGTLFTVLAVAGNALMVGIVGIVCFRAFFGTKRGEPPRHPHSPPPDMWVAPLLLAGAGLLTGIFPTWIGDNIIETASSVITASEIDIAFYTGYGLDHGLTPMLILSVITIAAGVAVYFTAGIFRRVNAAFDPGTRIGPQRIYQSFVHGLPDFARRVTQTLQTGHLTNYIVSVLLVFIGLTTYTLLSRNGLPELPVDENMQIYELLLAVVIALAAIFIGLRSRSRLQSITALGVVGYGVAITFVLFNAPDLAMTQFSIETLTVVLFVLVIYRLPLIKEFSSRRRRVRDMIIAGIGGLMMTLLVLTLTAEPTASRLAPYFAANSYVQAQGHNVVNVILVDFRGLDTFFEITVLALSAIGVYALLKLNPESETSQEAEEQEQS